MSPTLMHEEVAVVTSWSVDGKEAMLWEKSAIGVVAVLTVGFMQLLFFPLLDHFITFEDADVELYDFLKANPLQLVFIIIMGWLIGGLYEEIVFHENQQKQNLVFLAQCITELAWTHLLNVVKWLLGKVRCSAWRETSFFYAQHDVTLVFSNKFRYFFHLP